MYPSDNKIDSDEVYQKEMENLVSEVNKNTQKMFKKLKEQSKPQIDPYLKYTNRIAYYQKSA